MCRNSATLMGLEPGAAPIEIEAATQDRTAVAPACPHAEVR
jgi:hypothetical protein